MTCADGRCLVMIGPPGAGKTSTGRLLSRRLALPFTDVDERIVANRGRSIPEIFANEGEAAFRKYEVEVIRLAVKTPGVLALGGGAVLSEQVRQLIEPHQVIYLAVSLDQVLPRVGTGSGRPLLNGDVAGRWLRLAAERAPIYASVANHIVDTDARSVREVVKEILRILGEHDAHR